KKNFAQKLGQLKNILKINILKSNFLEINI
ncbi:MAG: hypothetical protein Q620_VSAC00244G0003, partial [Veillonella sp. DORA_A_3_16_22]